MRWDELSEVCFGLVLTERHPASLYRPEYFTAPYDKGIEILQKKGTTKEDVAKVINSSYLSDASSAVHKFNGLGEFQNYDWSKALIKAAKSFEMSKKWSKVAKKLSENEDVDLLPLYGELGNAIAGESSGLLDARDIDYKSYKPFIKSGNPVWDKILGGIPADGPIIKCGTTGTGKSHSAASDIDYFLAEHKQKKAALYTLEMSAEHYLWRETNMYPSLVDRMQEGRLKVSGSVKDIDELIAEVLASNVDIVALDDVDNIVRAQEASEYERVNKRITEVCRFMKIPFIALCQPNREAKKAIDRGERFLSLYDSSWSGSGENKAALYVSLQRVADGLDMESQTFPTEEGEELFYEIFWKSRDGWPSDYQVDGQRGPGAIVRYKSTQAWRGKPYSNVYKLWQPNSSSKKIGKNKAKKED
jgi:hypothetical protein